MLTAMRYKLLSPVAHAAGKNSSLPTENLLLRKEEIKSSAAALHV
jgi:hypothetical protein